MNTSIDESAFLAWLDAVMTDELPEEPRGAEYLLWVTHLFNHAEAYLRQIFAAAGRQGLMELELEPQPLAGLIRSSDRP